MDIKPHQQRVFDEHIELHERINKLQDFLSSEIFASLANIEQRILNEQLCSMLLYRRCLAARIEFWGFL